MEQNIPQNNIPQQPQGQVTPLAPAVQTPVQTGVATAENPEQVVTDAIESKPVEIVFEFPTNAYFVSGIREFVLNLTKNMTGFSEQWAFRFQAVVDELCNNAIEHGSRPGEKLRVTFLSTSSSLEALVEDTGTGKDKMNPESMKKLLESRQNLTQEQYLGFRGRGLPKIVSEWTDSVVFETSTLGGLCVHIKKDLRKEDDVVSSQQSNDPTHLVLT